MWFLRIGILLVGLVLAPLGIRINYTGATFAIVSFASWALPVAVLKLYLWAERSPRVGAKYSVALVSAVGSVAAGVFMWWPYM